MLALVFLALVAAGEIPFVPRPIDGVGNNVENPTWGALGTSQLRLMDALYQDGFGQPVENSNPRTISNLVVGYMPANPSNVQALSDYLTFWGQFTDHDLVLTLPGTEQFPIPIPLGDPWFNPNDLPDLVMSFQRAAVADGSGVPGRPREYPNNVTSFLDASMVYGSEPVRAAALRLGRFGLLNYTNGTDGLEYLPYNWRGLPNANDARRVRDEQLFLAGDVRANENPGLTSLHTLFLREHNRLARMFRARNASLTDEDLYQMARRWVVATIQAITFNEYAPLTTGSPLPPYAGYNASVNPTINLFFSGAAFRYGHSEVNTIIARLNEDRSPLPQGQVLLRDGFFNPPSWVNEGIDPILRGLATQRQQQVDLRYVDDIRNFLFGLPGQGGFDLAARNIQRGRDYGLASYSDARAHYGLSNLTTFEEVLPYDPVWAQLLSQAYGGNMSKVEPYVGGLAEAHGASANVGPLFAAAIQAQYIALRDGDRFYYKTPDAGFSAADIALIDATKLADVILRNTGIASMPCAVFTVTGELDCGYQPPVPGGGEATFLDGRMHVAWTLSDDSIEFTVTSQGNGWFAFGPSPDLQMVGTDLALVQIEPSGAITLTDGINVLPKGSSGVVSDESRGGTNDLNLISRMQAGGVTRVTYSRKLVTGDPNDVNIIVGENPVAFATSSAGQGQRGYHSGNRGSARVNFQSGAVTPPDSVWLSETGPTFHGWLMVVAWALFVPFGSIIARFFKSVGHWWFRLHVFLQCTALLFAVIAFMLALLMVQNSTGNHFATPHGKMGLAVVILGLVTGIVGQWANASFNPDRAKTPWVPDKLHWFFGYVTFILAVVNLFFGLGNLEAPTWVYSLLGAWIGVVVIFSVVMQLRSRGKSLAHDASAGSSLQRGDYIKLGGTSSRI